MRRARGCKVHAPLGLPSEVERGQLAGSGLALQLHVGVARSGALGRCGLGAAPAQPAEQRARQEQRGGRASHHAELPRWLQRVETLLEVRRKRTKAAAPRALAASVRRRSGARAATACGRAARNGRVHASARRATRRCEPGAAAQARRKVLAPRVPQLPLAERVVAHAPGGNGGTVTVGRRCGRCGRALRRHGAASAARERCASARPTRNAAAANAARAPRC